MKSNQIEKCDYILCTGLFDDHDEDLKYYKNLFKNNIKKKMICTNPDLIVDKGGVREFCAGSVAMIFEKMGGEVVYFGKPYPEVYNQSTDNINKESKFRRFAPFMSVFKLSPIDNIFLFLLLID